MEPVNVRLREENFRLREERRRISSMMRRVKKLVGPAILVGLIWAVMAVVPAQGAQPLPPGCEKDKGTVTCTTVEGPGKNKGGVGNVTTDETKGNTTNKNPEPQELADEECEQSPPKSQGGPITCP